MKYCYLFGVLSLLLAAGCSREKAVDHVAAAAAATPKPVQVRVALTETRKIEKWIAVTGSLMPDESVNVSSEVSGRIVSIPVDFGQTVKKGDVVAEFDKQEFQINLERAQAALAQALARIGLDPSQVEVQPESTPAMRQAAAQLEDARYKYENAAKLVKSGDISQERFTELEKAYRARQAAHEATQHELRTMLASIQALRAEVRLARKKLSDATVRAPFAGSVSARLASPGQYMKDNAPIVTLVKTHPLRLRAEIPEPAAGSVRIGTALTFTTDAAEGGVYQAVVRELNPSLDPKSRSLTAEARLIGNTARLRPGMFVQVRLVTERDATVVTAPTEALYRVAGLTKLFVVRDGKAVEYRVPAGAEIDGWVEIPESIAPGEAVAISNQAALINGSPVESVQPAKKG